jgi:alpha-mannosidase
VWHLRLDVEVLTELMQTLAPGEARRHEILRALERMLDVLDLADISGTATVARSVLEPVLAAPAHHSAHRISAVGHAHIDSAWLWPVRETRRKCARTFSNVVALAGDYPELVFACSSAQQYAWVKEHYPTLFDRIKDAVRAGQWAPVGGMWVESDANLPGGEAFVRQLVHGRRFFRDELGVDCGEVWLPDSFGYSAALPQLARLAGARWFLSQKLSWNRTNKFPHHSFWWEGIDGTRVFTHFPPADTYNGKVTGAELAHAAENFAEKGAATRSLLLFGYGDGGGGPTREMLERARRFHDLEGAPRVTVESPTTFFAAAEAEYLDAPVWSGELYLETHRGTYTSQAAMKSGNRRSEHLLREAELWSTAAAVQAGRDYPYDALDRLWKVVLLHQFHDILPGSSIGWVHREAAARYAEVAAELETCITEAMAALLGPAATPVLANAAPFRRREAVVLSDGQGLEGQHLAGGGIAVWADVPAMGMALAADPPDEAVVSAVTTSDGGIVLDNGLLRVRIGSDGLLSSVRDLVADREVLAPGGGGNLLRLSDDHPVQFDAWDLDEHVGRRGADLLEHEGMSIADDGPLLARVQVSRAFGSSRVTQTIALAAGSRRVDLQAEVDWQESEKVLTCRFPLDVHAAYSSAEVQFGHVDRPTHSNTSWDAAKFEISAHRWLHVAEPGFGVGLVNRATYGHSVGRATRPGGGTTTSVQLTLLRAPRFPDPVTDRGPHTLHYSLFVGDLVETVAQGYALNLPVRVLGGGTVPEPLLQVDDPRVVVEAVKLSDDRSGDVVVRLYEASGGHVVAGLRSPLAVSRWQVCDLLEDELDDPALAVELHPVDGGVRLHLRPFQVATLRLRLSD